MSDLTDNLRAMAEDAASDLQWCADAADEIDKLLILRDDYKADAIKMQRERDALRERVKVLEEALGDIVDTNFFGGPQAKRARAALKRED